MVVKINNLEIENVKRVKAVKIQPSENGLTVIGGKNNQGKTSILDSIAWALGGNRYKPSNPNRDESMVPPEIKVELSNGLIVERKGKNSNLKIKDPSGKKAGQTLLDSFVEELAINLPKFMDSSSKEKSDILLQIIGVGDQLHELETKENKLYQERLMIGRIKEQKQKYADELPFYEDAPSEMISISDLIQQQQAVLAKNGQNQALRNQRDQLQQQFESESKQIEQLEKQLSELKEKANKTYADLQNANKTAGQLTDESTEEIEKNIQNIELINNKVKTNNDKEIAQDEAQEYFEQYQILSDSIDKIRKSKKELLNNAKLPLPELTIENGEIIYKGQQWDNMSGSQQLMVSTAIVRELKPECGFILLDKLEQMDLETLQEFGAWLEHEGLQAIATRVSSGEECQIIIEDGYSLQQEAKSEEPKWVPGKF